MNRKITITNAEGQKVNANVVSIISVNSLKNDYIIYTFDKKDEQNRTKDYVSRIKLENGEYILESINDNDEWSKIKEIILNMEKNN